MSDSLVIAEKPSQARNLRDALGNRFGRILSARGHIFRLAEPAEVNVSWKKWSYEVLRPESGFYPLRPDKSHGKDKLIAEIKAALKDADRVIIATDCDREGQAIGENILRYFKYKGEVLRAMFSAEDPVSLRQAFDALKPNEQFRPLYSAAVARAQSDQIANLTATRAVTMALKPYGMKGAIGIGRVKTPTMGIVCAREREIQVFEAKPYFDLWVDVGDGKDVLRLKHFPAHEARVFENDLAQQITASFDPWHGSLKVTFEKKKQPPPRLMDLPLLQQRAARWGWSAQKTLDVAQSLYETHKITTYPRAETKYLPEIEKNNAQAMLDGLRDLPFVKVAYETPTYRMGKRGCFSDEGLAGASHHAIIPNSKTRDKWARVLSALSSDERRLFELIALSYTAAIGPDRLYDRTEMSLMASDRKFAASGIVEQQPGWREALGADPDASKKSNAEAAAILPPWKDRQIVDALKAGADKKTTKPPARFNEGTLIKAMQEAWKYAHDPKTAERLKGAAGIGTPATRASILEGLKTQNLFEVVNKHLVPSTLALAIYDVLLKEAPEILDPAATAEMELALDGILKGEQNPRTVIDTIVARAAALAAKMEQRGQSGTKLDIDFTAKPSPKMVQAARSKAKRMGMQLPKGAATDRNICSKFLGPRPEGNSPSDAQIAFALKIASEAKLDLPEATLGDRTALSAFIKKNKSKLSKSGAKSSSRPG
ncbi:MAG: DNA topoisomerase-3 [Ascidiaceihabitans sp.]|jgi:DNA topoisomerase-3